MIRGVSQHQTTLSGRIESSPRAMFNGTRLIIINWENTTQPKINLEIEHKVAGNVMLQDGDWKYL